jgi:hypothetical protein
MFPVYFDPFLKKLRASIRKEGFDSRLLIDDSKVSSSMAKLVRIDWCRSEPRGSYAKS